MMQGTASHFRPHTTRRESAVVPDCHPTGVGDAGPVYVLDVTQMRVISDHKVSVEQGAEADSAEGHKTGACNA